MAAQAGATRPRGRSGPVEAPVGNHRLARLAALAQLSPALCLLVVLLVVPVVIIAVFSFYTHDPLQIYRTAITTENYRAILTDGLFRKALVNTLLLGTSVTVICALLAYPPALYISRAGRARQAAVVGILVAPLFTSVVVRAYAWTLLLHENGTVASLAAALHLPRPHLIGSLPGVVIGMVHIELPFMVLPVLASLRGIPESATEAARSLGARPFTVFRTVVAPLSAPGLATGATLVFAMTASALVQPMVLGGSRTFLLATLLYNKVEAQLDWPQGAALGFELLVLVLAATALSFWLGRQRGAR